jgi:hypothetical protein
MVINLLLFWFGIVFADAIDHQSAAPIAFNIDQILRIVIVLAHG